MMVLFTIKDYSVTVLRLFKKKQRHSLTTIAIGQAAARLPAFQSSIFALAFLRIINTLRPQETSH
jgi:hypothetical protein